MKAICPVCQLEMRICFSNGDGKKTRHHIICKSRGGKRTGNNIVKVSHTEHAKFHWLFSNKTPEEILDYLVHTFWGGQVQIIKDYANKN